MKITILGANGAVGAPTAFYVAVQGLAEVPIQAFNDGASHTLTMHYYADYGYACAFDDVTIMDSPMNDNCSGIIDIGTGFGSITGSLDD